MITSGLATLMVADLDRSVRFYTETLGFKLKVRFGPAWAEIDAGGGCILGLHPAGEHGPRPAAAPGSISIGFQVNQPIAEVVEVLSNRGVKFHGAIKADGPVKLAFFADPDGNPLYLAESVAG
jgi:catechol 2,3-dioxygenase-like lactoylglutathione lyase family enzyme